MRRILPVVICMIGLCGCAVRPSIVDLRINEIQTSGGDADWIELYNAGSNAVDLDGYFLSDDPQSPGKWRFPSVTVEAGEYLVVYADGGGTADSRLSASFSLKASGETVVLTKPNGTPLDTVSVPESAPGLSYGRDENNGFAQYATPTPNAPNDTGMILGQQWVNPVHGVRINEYTSRNQTALYDHDGDYHDFVEIYNFSDTAVDLSGYTLTDSKDEVTKWQFPNGTTLDAGAYLIVFCSGKETADKELHASFKLGDGDSFLGLYTANGSFCSGLSYRPTEPNTSMCFRQGGTYTPSHLITPGYANKVTE